MQRVSNSGAEEIGQDIVAIQTTRFGEISMERRRIIHFPEGILGFPHEQSFVILEHKPGSPFWWLQSTVTPELAFVMMSPFLVEKDYLDALPASEKRLLEGEEASNYVLFVLVTIPKGQVEKMTVNLLGPILIDSKRRIGRQLVLANSSYSTRHPVVSETC